MKNLLKKKYNKLATVILCVVLFLGLLLTGCSYGPFTYDSQNGFSMESMTTDDEGDTVQIEVSETNPVGETENLSQSSEACMQVKNPEENAETDDNATSNDSTDVSQDISDESVVDLIFFMGQSNMAGAGGNVNYAPKVLEEAGYEFRAVSDPTKLYPITEPFGINENNLNAIMDVPGAKRGSLVSAFANKYYELTGTPIVAVSASAGATDTDFWMSAPVVSDYTERMKRAIVWLESSGYTIRHKYVIWLQGESDAIVNTSSEEYESNMDTIIRPMFIEGLEKVFYITPGRTITRKDYFEKIISAQVKMSKESGYYALGTTILSGISTEYMVDEWHYNQKVLNLVGEECAKSVAYYTINGKECSLYDYKNNVTFVPSGEDIDTSEVTPIDFSKIDLRIN